MKTRTPHVSEAALSATIVGIDDFALGFVQTYIAEHFSTESPTVEQIEAALRALEEYGGYHGLQGRAMPGHGKVAIPSVEAMCEELARRSDD
jgi:hypothetical protein